MALALDDLPKKVLLELRVIGGDDTPTANDQSFVLDEYRMWRDEAERDWNITWDEDDDVPSGAEKAVIYLMANRVAVYYAKAWSPERQKMGEDLLRLSVRRKPTYEPPQGVDYF